MSLSEEQLALRRTGIGGSEVAAILGESRFAAPFDVWLSKTQGWRQEETEDMRRGSFLEAGIAAWYAHRYGLDARQLEEPGTLQHRTMPRALCTPDRLAWTSPGVGPRLVSIKAPRRGSDDWGEPGTDKVPAEYALQLQWEHAVCRSLPGLTDVLGEMHLAALLDGELCVYPIAADLELQGWMLEFAHEWWARHVERGEQPSLDGSSQAREWLKKRFPRDSGEVRPATPHETRLLVELQLAQAEFERWDGETETLKGELKLSMGTAQRIESPAGVASWKTNVRGVRSFTTKFTNKEK